MKDVTKEELLEGVNDISNDIYEAMAPAFIESINKTNAREDLTDGEKSDEILIDTIAFIKSATNRILVEALAELFELEDE